MSGFYFQASIFIYSYKVIKVHYLSRIDIHWHKKLTKEGIRNKGKKGRTDIKPFDILIKNFIERVHIAL